MPFLVQSFAIPPEPDGREEAWMIPSYRAVGLGIVCILLALSGPLYSQGYRVRLDSRIQGVSWRGLNSGTIPRSQAILQPNGGFLTPDGNAALCGETTCTFFTAGPSLRGMPWVSQLDLTAWGFGVSGLSLRVNGRTSTDLGTDGDWPGTQPEVELVEGYLEYQRGGLNLRGGRQYHLGRLGSYGFDGGRLSYRPDRLGIEVMGYLGWGLARGVSLPVTDEALNPLNDFQPRDRQIVAGGDLSWATGPSSLRLEYRRELDPETDHFVSERGGISWSLQPHPSLRLAVGGEYDFSFDEIGTAEASLTWSTAKFSLTGGGRRYQPFFDLWTIWGAFSPVAYHAGFGSLSLSPIRPLTLRVRGERFIYEDTETNTPLVTVEDRGWRFSWGATWVPTKALVLDGGWQSEFAPGGSSRGLDGRVTVIPSTAITMSANAGWLERPLDFRFSDAELFNYGGDLEIRPTSTWRLGLQGARVIENRSRPDASGIDWGQWRFTARVTWDFGSSADRLPLPRAVRTRNRGLPR